MFRWRLKKKLPSIIQKCDFFQKILLHFVGAQNTKKNGRTFLFKLKMAAVVFFSIPEILLKIYVMTSKLLIGGKGRFLSEISTESHLPSKL
jgi:hypothetical protein